VTRPRRPSIPGALALRAGALAGLVAAAVLVARWLPEPAARLAELGGGLGPAAAAALPALYLPWMVLGIPTAPLALAAGFALGPLAGGLVALLGCTGGACAAFLAARRFGHRVVERLAARFPAVPALRRAVKARGFRLVLLLRLAPVMPVPFLNHVLGLTSVALRPFALATLLGTAPSAFVAASAGSVLRDAGARMGAAAARLDGAALVAAAALSLALGGLALRTLARELSRPDPGAPPAP
jgi:uncharacterized membrane protein YdjX (TVP38/TMEM64 family)